MKEKTKNVLAFVLEFFAGAAMIVLIVSEVLLLKKEIRITPKETAVIEWDAVQRINREKISNPQKPLVTVVEEAKEDDSAVE